MVSGQDADEAAVALFGEGAEEIGRAETGLDVAECDLAVVAGQAGGEDSGCVALGEDHVGALGLEDAVEARDEERGELGERLARLHDAEVGVGRDVEERGNLVEERAVLAGEQDAYVETRSLPEGSDDGRELDRFGARAQSDEDGLHDSDLSRK